MRCLFVAEFLVNTIVLLEAAAGQVLAGYSNSKVSVGKNAKCCMEI
jgi:hypothetical protein